MNDNWNIAFYRAPLSPEPSERLSPKILLNAAIGREYWKVSIQQIPKNLPYRKSLQEIVDSLHEDEPLGKGAIFHGSYGTGKSSSAAIVLKAGLCRGGQGYFVRALDLKKAHDKSWATLTPEGITVWDMITRSQLVVVDDLGAEAQAEYGRGPDTRIVESLIRARYDNQLATYITTNFDLATLSSTYSSIASILLYPARFRTVAVRGKSWRN